MTYDVIIVGAGPGGSAAAAFLARRGITALLLDKARFPRHKVCGDGLTPQALHWLDVLGCVDEVLGRTDACIRSCDLYINNERVLTGSFLETDEYPGFCTLLERRTLDDILAEHAVGCGASFRAGCGVRRVEWERDGVVAEVLSEGEVVRFKGRILIGADGANSIVSRALGNRLADGTRAASIRGYYRGVSVEGSQVKIFFNERFFPGYGWVFVDDSGRANIGIGYAFDRNFPVPSDLNGVFQTFVREDLKGMTRSAEPDGPTAAWWAGFFRPRSLVGDRVLLVGDAANLADPVSGGGIHKAVESGFVASRVVEEAFAAGDCTKAFLSRYAELLDSKTEMDRRTGELLLTCAKNSDLKHLYLMFLRAVGRVASREPVFQQFCSGIFSGGIPTRWCLSPQVLWKVVPRSPSSWVSAFSAEGTPDPGGRSGLASALFRNGLKAAGNMARRPLGTVDWGLEVLNRSVDLANLRAGT